MSRVLKKYSRETWLKALALLVMLCLIMPTISYAEENTDDGNSGTSVATSGGFGDYLGAQGLDPAESAKNCNPSRVGGYLTNECPKDPVTGKLASRNDIEAACIERINKGGCLNTMPTSGVQRVPEDVCRRSPTRNHNGMDYAANEGTPVTAAADGYIESTTECLSGGGRSVFIRHSKGGVLKSRAEFSAAEKQDAIQYKKDTYRSAYLHLSEINIKMKAGTWVNKGDEIGLVGGSNCGASGKPVDRPVTGGKNGGAYGAHLHFEIQDGDKTPLDPMCSDIQGLCGGNKMDTTSCRKNCKEEGVVCQPSTYSGGGSVGDDTGTLDVASADAKCNWESFRSSYETCIFCDIFKILFNVASSMATKAFETFASIIQKMVVLGAGLWIAFVTVSFITSMEVKEPSAYVKNLIAQMFIVIIVYLLLEMTPEEFLKLAIEPIFNTGLRLANMAMDGTECTNEWGLMENGGMPVSIGISILCVIKSTQDKILDILALGSTSICIGFKVKSWKQIPIFPHLGYVLVGLLLWITSILLLIIYPFLLVDSVLKLSIAMALMPAAIGCYAFKITRSYVGKIFETIMNSMFAFVFLSIMLYILIEQINLVVGDTIVGVSTGNSNETTFLEELSWTGVKVLQMIFIMLLAWAVLEEGEKFAGEFAGGLKTDVGRKTGGLGVNTAHKMAKGALNLTKGVRSSISNGIKRSVGEGYSRMTNRFQASRIRSRGTMNEDGSYTMTTRNKLFGLVGRKVSKTVDADGTITRNTLTGKHAGTERKKDNFIHSERIKLADGSEQVVTRMLTAGGRSMINNDGSVNMTALNAIRQNSNLDDTTVKTAIMNQFMKEQMPGYAHKMESVHTSREVKSFHDENGNEIFEITQINADGTKSVFRMTMSGKTNRIKLDVEENSKDEKQKRVYSTDGIVNKSSVINAKVDKDGKTSYKEEARYSFTQYYSKYNKKPIDSLGKMSLNIPESDIMYNDTDMDNLRKQFYVKGRNEDLKGFRGDGPKTKKRTSSGDPLGFTESEEEKRLREEKEELWK